MTTREAVIQVYAAGAVSWRGVFSVHTWFAVKPTGAERFTRYEIWLFRPYIQGWINYYSHFYKSELTPTLQCIGGTG